MKGVNLTLENIFDYGHILPKYALYAVWSTKERKGIKGVNAVICTFSENNGLDPWDANGYDEVAWLDEFPPNEIKIQFLEEL